MELKELYQEIILDHGKNPRNKGKCEGFTNDAKAHNTLCGDKVHIYLKLNKDKKIDTIMVEVKPFKETKEPKIQTRKTLRYINEVKTYAINTYKWKYAREYCADRRWKFIIITEKELGRRPWYHIFLTVY